MTAIHSAQSREMNLRRLLVAVDLNWARATTPEDEHATTHRARFGQTRTCRSRLGAHAAELVVQLLDAGVEVEVDARDPGLGNLDEAWRQARSRAAIRRRDRVPRWSQHNAVATPSAGSDPGDNAIAALEEQNDPGRRRVAWLHVVADRPNRAAHHHSSQT